MNPLAFALSFVFHRHEINSTLSLFKKMNKLDFAECFSSWKTTHLGVPPQKNKLWREENNLSHSKLLS